MMTKHSFLWAIVNGLIGCSITMVCQAQNVYSPSDRDALARSAYARGDIPRAAAALNESVRVNPFDPVALNNLAVNYAAQGDYQNALSLLERALRIAPNRSDIMNNHANLRAWMSQDSQFALGSRPTNTPLNFPRAEDSPQNFPPLWSPPPQMQNPPIVRAPGQQNLLPPVSNQSGYGNYVAPQNSQNYYQQNNNAGYAQQPLTGYSSGLQNQANGYPSTIAYPANNLPIQAYPQAIAAAPAQQVPQPVPVMRKQSTSQQSTAPQANDLNIARKKKRPVAVDCKVEP